MLGVEFMKKLTLLLCVFFAGISYAEEDNKTHDDKLKHIMYDMSVIEKQLEAYKKENGNYPTTEEGLEHLKKYNVTVVPDHIVPNRFLEGNMPFSRAMKWEGYKFPRPDTVDGWDRKYEYKSNGVKYSIHSYGEDGMSGGAGASADIVIFSSKK